MLEIKPPQKICRLQAIGSLLPNSVSCYVIVSLSIRAIWQTLSPRQSCLSKLCYFFRFSWEVRKARPGPSGVLAMVPKVWCSHLNSERSSSTWSQCLLFMMIGYTFYSALSGPIRLLAVHVRSFYNLKWHNLIDLLSSRYQQNEISPQKTPVAENRQQILVAPSFTHLLFMYKVMLNPFAIQYYFHFTTSRTFKQL